jgi:hypothetical protein
LAGAAGRARSSVQALSQAEEGQDREHDDDDADDPENVVHADIS